MCQFAILRLASVALLLLSCRGEDTFVKVSLTSNEGNITSLGRLDVSLSIDGTEIIEGFDPSADDVIDLPTSIVFDVASGAGTMTIKASGTAAESSEILRGEGDVDVVRGKTASMTISLSRQQPGNDGSTSDGSDGLRDGGGDDQDANPAEPADSAPACTDVTRAIVANMAVGIDYNPPTEPNTKDFIAASRGLGHGHEHDYIAWFRFSLAAIPQNAKLRAARLRLKVRSVLGAPVPVVVYSDANLWNTESGPGTVPRTADVSLPLAPILEAGTSRFALTPLFYEPFWVRDLSDDHLTLGIAVAGTISGPERYAHFEPPQAAESPTLEIETCEVK